MATFTPIIKKGPRSSVDPTPVYTLDLAEITNGEDFKSLGLGSPQEFLKEDELLVGVETLLKRFFTPFSDLILWDHEEHGDIPSALVHIGSNPLAQQEELQGLR